jgi:hypothetical protein
MIDVVLAITIPMTPRNGISASVTPMLMKKSAIATRTGVRVSFTA